MYDIMGENKYKDGKIYRITDVAYTKCYVGSTCETLCRRMARQRERYIHGKERGRTVNLLFDEFGLENCKIELIQQFSCEDKMELLKQEGYHIRNNNCVNKIIAGRSRAEYWETYKQENKDKIDQKNKKWNENKKEYIRKYRQVYNAKNAGKHQEYYQSRKHILSEKHLCGCGMHYTFQHKKRHEKCKHHQEWLKQQEQKEPELEDTI